LSTQAGAQTDSHWRWLAGILLLGAGLRLYAIWFGLPYMRARPDETDAVMHAQMVMRGDLNPHFFHWPSLTFYTFGAVFTAVSDVIGALTPGAVISDARYLVVARIIVALAGTATIAVLYDLTRRIADTWTGLAAATFLAVAILHVRESHFAMTDVLMTLLATASLALLAHAVDAADAHTDPLRWFAASGLVGGLAASTKYNAAAVVVAMAAVQLVWLVRSRGKAATPAMWLPAAIFAAAFVVGFFIGTPYAAIDSQTFLADLRFDLGHLAAGHGHDLGRGWSYHLTRSLPYGVGITTSLAALAGVIPLARHYGARAAAVGAFALVSYVSFGSGREVFFRYLLPVVPIVCLFAAVAVRHGGLWIASRTRLSSGVGTTMLIAVVAGPPLVNCVRFDVLLARTDSRVMAADWLRQRVTPDETLYEEGGHYAAIDLGDAPVHRWSFNPADGSFGDTGGRTPDWIVLEGSPLWTWAGTSPEIRKLAAERYTLARSIRAADDGWAVYDLADAFFLPVAGFLSVERPGPNVLIYRRRDLPAVAP
jgi:4-amino-4-deoxy-L-arabinose transferase-like glycosyltransferase